MWDVRSDGFVSLASAKISDWKNRTYGIRLGCRGQVAWRWLLRVWIEAAASAGGVCG